MGLSVCEAIASTAARHTDRAAAVFDDRHVGYGELSILIDRLALRLGRRGLGAGDVVGISVSREIDHLVASLALLRLGCRQVALATFDPEPMRRALAEQCGVVSIVAEGEDRALPGCGIVVPDFSALYGADEDRRPAPPHADPDEVALLLPTSGTTGRPKIIAVTQRQIVARAAHHWGTAVWATSYPAASIEFNAIKREHLAALVAGRTTVLAGRSGHGRPDRRCRDVAADLLWISTMQARAMMDGAAADAPPLLGAGTQVFTGGSTVPAALRADIQRRLSPRLHVVYGATEVGRVSIARPEHHRAGHDGVGAPLPGVEAEIVDEAGAALPAGRAGEIRVRTAGIAAGYFRDPAATARAFRDGWYHTGDVGVLSAEGLLTVDGRVDDMMCLNSVNVFPLEIEAVVEGFPGVVECAAFPLRSPVHGDIPVAAVTLATAVDLGELQRYCRAKLGIRAPRKFVAVAELPRNDAGKVLRNELADLLER